MVSINRVTGSQSFCANGVRTNQEQPEKKMPVGAKVLIGTSLTALAAAGIYIATRGRSKVTNLETSKAEEIIEQAIEKPKNRFGEFMRRTDTSRAKFEAGKEFALRNGGKRVDCPYVPGTPSLSRYYDKDGNQTKTVVYELGDNNKISMIDKSGRSGKPRDSYMASDKFEYYLKDPEVSRGNLKDKTPSHYIHTRYKFDGGNLIESITRDEFGHSLIAEYDAGGEIVKTQVIK